MAVDGIERKIDELGRVVLPMEMRKALDMVEKSTVNIRVEGNKITLERVDSHCQICGRTGSDLVIDQRCFICPECIERIRNMDVVTE